MTDLDFGPTFELSATRMAEVDKERRRLADMGIPFQISFLDDIAYGILPTDLIVLAAQTGSGKTTLGMLFAVMAARAGRHVHYFALEAHRREIEQRLLFREMQRLVWERKLEGRHSFAYGGWLFGECEALADRVRDDAMRALSVACSNLYTFYRDRRFDRDDIVRLFCAIQHESDLIVFDHLHHVDSDDANDNRAMRDIVKTIGDTALEIETPVVAIAHMRKRDNRSRRLIPTLDDFHGASDITKIATRAIALAPAHDRESSEASISNTYMAVLKDRIVGRTPYAAVVRFDQRTTAYETRYTLGRMNPAGTEFTPLSPLQRPWWAENAVCVGSPPEGVGGFDYPNP